MSRGAPFLAPVGSFELLDGMAHLPAEVLIEVTSIDDIHLAAKQWLEQAIGPQELPRRISNVAPTTWKSRTSSARCSPAAIPAIGCFQGSFGSTLECESATADGSTAHFEQSDLFFHSGMTVAIAIPKGVVPPPKPILEQRWTFGRAFANAYEEQSRKL